eukprot:jgi/Ulvmu1/8261/UM041_0072.1
MWAFMGFYLIACLAVLDALGVLAQQFKPSNNGYSTHSDFGSCLDAEAGSCEFTTTWQNHIVRLNEYRHLAQVHSSLREHLTELEGWKVIERSNSALAFPTDFAVISVSSSHADAVIGTLLDLSYVKDVRPDRQLRSLQGQESQEVGRQQFSADSDVQKSSGRLRTRWSNEAPELIEDGIDELRNAAAILQARKSAHERSQSGLSLRKADSANGSGIGSVHSRSARHLLPWGPLAEIDLNNSESLRSEVHVRHMLGAGTQVSAALGAPKLWSQGYKGKNVRVGVFDTGIREGHPHIKNLRERSNWTHENTLSDELGHGTFVAGVIGGNGDECPGLAPDVLLHTFKVFTNDQVSFTSWFLDAFNYAIATKMQVVNLSIGGPDFMDRPFVDKVQEITANGIIMVSAIGNDGPLYGTLNNPADQLDVIGVGGLDYSDNIASFSSRGMSTWELPTGFGGSKPDVMAYGRDVHGSRIGGGCRPLSGTSVASPVVAGAVALLASIVPEGQRDFLLNPASMKQALVEGASRLSGLNVFEQGSGKLDLEASQKILQSYQPRASIHPSTLDLTDCPYMWPYCLQPLYARAQPVIYNATILNGMGVWGILPEPPRWEPLDEGGKHIDVIFTHSDVIWPWSGHLTLFITVKDDAAEFSGPANGVVKFRVLSPPKHGSKQKQVSTVEMSMVASIVPTPPRKQRLLWDQFHSVKYPPAYLPRDNLEIRSDILDWHGDHLLTNYHSLYTYLRDNGLFVEILASPFTCFNATEYAALIIADSEEEFYPDEIKKLETDVHEHGLGVLLFPEWYSLESMSRMRFFDDNTRSWWSPATGGSNIPAINDLVASYGLAFGDTVLHGMVSVGTVHRAPYASGTHLIKAPAGCQLLSATLQDRTEGQTQATAKSSSYYVLSLLNHGSGRIAVFGDSNCVDGNHATVHCHDLLLDMFQWAAGGDDPAWTTALTELESDLIIEGALLPERPTPDLLRTVSHVLNNPMQCYLNSAVGMKTALQDLQTTVRDKDTAEYVQGLDEPVQMRNPAGSATSEEQTTSPASGQTTRTPLLGPSAVVAIAFIGLAMMLWIWSRNRNKNIQRMPMDNQSPGHSSPDSTSALSKVSRGPLQRR